MLGGSIQTTMKCLSVDSLPPELIYGIIQHLPLNSQLTPIGLAHSTFAKAIFSNLASARSHFKHILSVTGNQNIWVCLDSLGIKFNGWLTLPANYKTAIYGEILQAEEWEGIAKWIGDDMANNLMWYLRWETTQKQAYEIIRRLLETSYFDPTAQLNRTVRFMARLGHLDVVKMLVERCPKVDVSDRNNYAIYCAAAGGNLEMVRYLLENPRVDPSAEDNLAIQYAAQYNYIDIVRVLMQDPRTNPARKENMCLRSACEHGRSELVQLLLSDERVDPADLNNACIQIACENGHYEVVRILLNDPRVDAGASNNYAINSACRRGHTKVVELLLADSKVDPGARNGYPIKAACFFEHTDVVALLVKHPKVNVAEDGNSVLLLAAKVGHLSLVRLLLAHPGVDPSILNNAALCAAHSNKHWEVVDALWESPRVRELVHDEDIHLYTSHHEAESEK